MARDFNALLATSRPMENVALAIQQARNTPYLGVTVRDQPWAAAMDPDHCQHWERELTPDFPFSDPYFALYHAALLQTGGPRLDRVVTGLPVNQYLNNTLRKSLIERLQGKHRAPVWKLCHACWNWQLRSWLTAARSIPGSTVSSVHCVNSATVRCWAGSRSTSGPPFATLSPT